MIAIIRHIDIEGPGYCEDFLATTRSERRIIALDHKDPLPAVDTLQGLILLGGPMNVYEEKRYPFLRDEDVFLREVCRRNIPCLGICLGAQLLAKALGGAVTKAPAAEIGWHTVVLTEEGVRDPLFAGIDRTARVFQWHEDQFALPAGGILLASGESGIAQAVRFTDAVYGLQFHIEVTAGMVASWIQRYLPEGTDRQSDAMLTEFSQNMDAYRAQAVRILSNFARIIDRSGQAAR